VIPCCLVIYPAVGCAAVRPVQVQAARLDARSLRLFSACPTSPTCPTKNEKREQEDSVCCRNLSMRFIPARKQSIVVLLPDGRTG